MAKKRIEIEISTFKRLQRNSEPLVDTLDSVINCALDALEERKKSGKLPTIIDGTIHSKPTTADQISKLPVMEVTTNNLPILTFSKVLSATVDGQEMHNPKWNNIMYHLVEMLVNRGHSVDELNLLFSLNLTPGKHISTKNSTYIPNLDVSIQSKSADESCRKIISLAQKLGININIEFMWRNKQNALYPGRKARLRI